MDSKKNHLLHLTGASCGLIDSSPLITLLTLADNIDTTKWELFPIGIIFVTIFTTYIFNLEDHGDLIEYSNFLYMLFLTILKCIERIMQ